MSAKKELMIGFISVFILFGFFAILGFLLYGAFIIKTTIDGTLKDVLLVMLGSLGTMATMVVSYWFGTTNSSRAKDVLLYQQQPTGAQNANQQ